MSKNPKAQGDWQAPKGMHDLIGEEWYTQQGFFERAAELAHYYGFKPIATPILEQESLFARGVGDATDIVEKEMYTLKTKGGDKLALRPEGTAAVMRSYFEHGMQSQPQPLSFYYYGPFFRHESPQRGRFRQFYQFGLETIGTPKSIVDAEIIKLLHTILEESGLTDLVIEINSLGDADCRTAWRRELVNYFKKHTKAMCPDCRERLKTNPLRILDCKNPDCQALKKNAPTSVAYLCGACKSHFKEVLEYLDMMNLPYSINSNLVRGLDYYSRTVFEISSPSTEEGVAPLALASGGRYDYLARTLGSKKDIPAFGGSIGVERVVSHPQYMRHGSKIAKPPKIFFIQLSFDAKLKSLNVIEILRKAKVPVTHSLSKDSLGAQLAMAEKSGVPYTIILGQKEAVDGTVIVRNMDTRSQDTVPVEELAEYLKKIK